MLKLSMGRILRFAIILLIADSTMVNLRLLAKCISNSFEFSEVVPDVIPIAPTDLVEVKYPSEVKVEEGNELTPTQVKDIPSVDWNGNPHLFYTLAMIDPDAPSRREPIFRSRQHWLVGNIPGSDVAKGETLSAYVGAIPQEGSGLHRYVFLVYEQPGKLSFDEPRLRNTSGDKRGYFSIAKFAEKYDLGELIAGNFFQAEWDDYVPLLYKQLGRKNSRDAKTIERNGVVKVPFSEGYQNFVPRKSPDLVNVKYPFGVKVIKGIQLTPTDVKYIPSVSWDANPDKFYTLTMTDFGPTSGRDPRVFRERQHWLLGNIPGSDVDKGETLLGYLGIPESPQKSSKDLHRYVFLVYEQPDKLSFDEPDFPNTSGNKRRDFSIAKFIQKYNLGQSKAGNFFLA